jgi:DNA-binding XRE family transcriptional regulator
LDSHLAADPPGRRLKPRKAPIFIFGQHRQRRTTNTSYCTTEAPEKHFAPGAITQPQNPEKMSTNVTMKEERATIEQIEKRINDLEQKMKYVKKFDRLAELHEQIGYTLTDAAQLIGVTRKTLRSHISRGDYRLMSYGRVHALDVWAKIP